MGRPRRASALERSGAQQALVLTLEVGQYWVTKSGWTNRKSIELGTNYSVPLPWLTSLETPVNVLQLTGALMDRDGLAVRIGAEGMLARRTSLVMSGLGAQALISDDDVQQLRTLRREDLPGKPLVWQTALAAIGCRPDGEGGTRAAMRVRRRLLIVWSATDRAIRKLAELMGCLAVRNASLQSIL